MANRDIDQEFNSIVESIELSELRTLGPGRGTALAVLTGAAVQLLIVLCVAMPTGPIPVAVAAAAFGAGVALMARLISRDRAWSPARRDTTSLTG